MQTIAFSLAIAAIVAIAGGGTALAATDSTVPQGEAQCANASAVASHDAMEDSLAFGDITGARFLRVQYGCSGLGYQDCFNCCTSNYNSCTSNCGNDNSCVNSCLSIYNSCTSGCTKQ
jgi:hypothetical protein